MRDDLGIFPLTCEAYEQTRVKTIMETWGSVVLSNLIFLGDREVSDSETGSVLQLDCLNPLETHPKLTDNRYEDAPHKLFNAFRHLQNEKWEWLFFCDDDTYVKTSLLEDYVDSVERKYSKNHIGVWGRDLFGNYGEDRSLHYPSGGAGYLTNKATLQRLVPFLEGAPRTLPNNYGDVMLGYCMRDAVIPIIDDHVFYDLDHHNEWMEWQWSQGDPKVVKKPSITYHYMGPEKTIHFYNNVAQKIPPIYEMLYWKRGRM